MDSVKPNLGSKHTKNLDELGFGIKARNYERLNWEYDERPVGRCFVTNQARLGDSHDTVIQVNSVDKKGRPIIEKYRVGHVGFLHLVDRATLYRGWKGF